LATQRDSPVVSSGIHDLSADLNSQRSLVMSL